MPWLVDPMGVPCISMTSKGALIFVLVDCVSFFEGMINVVEDSCNSERREICFLRIERFVCGEATSCQE